MLQSFSISSFRYKKNYLLWLAGFFSLYCSLFFVAFALGSGKLINSYQWAALHLEKKIALAEKIQQPKILIISGSNAFFGLSAANLERYTSIPAVNLAVYAGMTIDYLRYSARNVAHKNDIILLPLEYEIYGQVGLTKETVQISYSLGLDYFFSLSLGDQIEYARLIDLERIYRGIEAAFSPAPLGRGGYWLLDVNNNGDILQTRPELANRKRILAQQKAVNTRYARAGSAGAISADSLRALRAMAKWAQQAQVRLIATYPNSVEGIPITAKVTAIKTALDDLDVTFLELPHKGFLPIEWMYDSRYHPAPQGKKTHTAIVAAALCKVIPDCRPPSAVATRVEQENLANTITAFTPFEKVQGLDEIFSSGSERKLPRVRRGYGPASSFSIFLNGCPGASLRITAQPLKSNSMMSVSMDQQEIASRTFSTDGFASWDVPLTGEVGFHQIKLRYPDWRKSDMENSGGNTSAFVFKELVKRQGECN